MAMGGGSGEGLSANINVTPMIDVLLVLLIVFMVVQQGLRKGLSVQVPPPKPAMFLCTHLRAAIWSIRP